MSTTVERTPAEPADTTDVDELAARVDRAVTAVAALEPEARAVAEELKDALEAVHRAGLVAIVRRLRSDETTRSVLFELVEQPVVAMLLSLHGILRPTPAIQAQRVLDRLRPQLRRQRGDATLVRINLDGTAVIRLDGACTGCSATARALRDLVEHALLEEVAEITRVEVLTDQPEPTLIPPQALWVRPEVST